MAEEAGRAAHGLAGIVEDEVEPRQSFAEPAREQLDARRVPQVDAVHLQPVAERGVVGLLRVARRGVDREARGDDHVRAGAQQLERGLVTDLDARAGDQRVAAVQVGGLLALGVVDVAAVAAHRVVVAVHLRVRLLADVAGQGGVEVRSLLRGGRVGVGRRQPERRVVVGTALDAQPGALDGLPVLRLLRLALGAPERLGHAAQVVAIGLRDLAGERQQFAALRLRQPRELAAIGTDGLEHPQAGAQVFVAERGVGRGVVLGHRRIVVAPGGRCRARGEPR